jgi:hypothetical protein
MSKLTIEARAGLTRAWLTILADRHPGTTWVSIGAADASTPASKKPDHGECELSLDEKLAA